MDKLNCLVFRKKRSILVKKLFLILINYFLSHLVNSFTCQIFLIHENNIKLQNTTENWLAIVTNFVKSITCKCCKTMYTSKFKLINAQISVQMCLVYF